MYEDSVKVEQIQSIGLLIVY
uniref:Uncharacterized protein n=1 Tax=Anguilla anguilla TaxID=7936 RepID=A0A0E9U7C7_ANGAN